MRPSELDKFFPKRGPCFLCGPRMDARHRVIDAIRSRRLAGESIAALAKDYEVSRRAIDVALAAVSKPLKVKK